MIMILADHTISLPKHPQWSKWPYAIKAKFSLYNSRCSTCKPSPTAIVVWSKFLSIGINDIILGKQVDFVAKVLSKLKNRQLD